MGAFKQSRLHQALKPHTKREWYLYIHIVLIRYLVYVCLKRQAKFCPFAIAKEREKNRKNAKWIYMIWIKCWRHWYYISFGGASGKLKIAKNMIDLVSNRNDAQYMIYHIHRVMVYTVVTHSFSVFCYCCYLQAPLVLTIWKDQNPSVFYKFCWFVFSTSLTHTVAVRCEMLYIEPMGECMIARDIEFMWRINALVCYFWPPSCSCPYKMLIQQNIDTLHKLFTAETKREKNLFASILKKQGSEIRFFVFCSLETYITICKRK